MTEIVGTQQPGETKKGFVARAKPWIPDAIALIFWTYVLIKLFVFDIDTVLVNRFVPGYEPLLRFRFFFFIGGFAILLLSMRSWRLLGWSAYVAFYPLLVIFVFLPVIVFKQRSWIFGFAFANTVISFFQSFKINFLLFAMIAISIPLAVAANNTKLLASAVMLSLIALVVLYVRRFISAFKPSRVLDVYLRFLPRVKNFTPQTFELDAEIKGVSIEVMTPTQLQKWTTTLQTVVLYNRACLFFSKKLEQYQGSKLNAVSYAFGLVSLTIVTVITFAVANFAVFKIDPGGFRFGSTPTAFAFFYYSFNNLFHASANVIVPQSPIPQSFYMLEVFFEFLLVALLISLCFSVSNERYSEDLRKVVAGLEREGRSIESLLSTEYKFSTVDDAIEALAKTKASLINQIYWITKHID